MQADAEPISAARRQAISAAISKQGWYEGRCGGSRFTLSEVTSPRHCIAWKVHAGGRWHAGYASNVEEARIRINGLIREATPKTQG